MFAEILSCMLHWWLNLTLLWKLYSENFSGFVDKVHTNSIFFSIPRDSVNLEKKKKKQMLFYVCFFFSVRVCTILCVLMPSGHFYPAVILKVCIMIIVHKSCIEWVTAMPITIELYLQYLSYLHQLLLGCWICTSVFQAFHRVQAWNLTCVVVENGILVYYLICCYYTSAICGVHRTSCFLSLKQLFSF